MNRRHLPALTAWLLPLLCLRAFLPAGFMPATTEAGLQLVLCNGGYYQTHYQTLPASSAGHDGQPAAPHGAGGPCLFAMAATTTGPAPAIQAFVDIVPAVGDSTPPFHLDHSLSRPLQRAQQSRAPPAFS